MKEFCVCSNPDFYKNVCPSFMGDIYCASEYPCGLKITCEEHRANTQEVAKAKALLEKLGYTVTKNKI